MKIDNFNFAQGISYDSKTQQNSFKNFSDALNMAKQEAANKKKIQDSYDAGADFGNIGVYSKTEVLQGTGLPIETERYKITDASDVEGVAAYKIVDKLSGNSVYIREDEVTIQKDSKTGLEFVINMSLGQPMSQNVLVTDELKYLLNGVANKNGFSIQETSLQGGLVVNEDYKTGLKYLSINGNESKAVSLIVTSEKDIEKFEKLVDEFQQYSVCNQRETAGLYALLEVSGNLKREKDGLVFLTPDEIRYIPYNGDANKAWALDILDSCYSKAREHISRGDNCADINSWKKILEKK